MPRQEDRLDGTEDRIVRRRGRLRSLAAAWAGLMLLTEPAAAAPDDGASAWVEDLKAARWEVAVGVAGATALGVANWDWGGSASFRAVPEGWFGTDTHWGGADKLGHALSAYAMTNVVAERLLRAGRSPERAALSGALTAQAFLLYIEVLDGFSGEQGFAREDIVMNLLGSGLAYARTVHPRLRELMDFRLAYRPSGYEGFQPFTDYAGQKYLLAWKLAGVAPLRDTPLRFAELHLGYYTRGFSDAEQDAGLTPTRRGFVGVGLNLSELFWGRRSASESGWRSAGRLFLEHIQLPYTAAQSSRAL